MNATCVLLRLESNWTNTCWVRLNHMWWCFLSNWGRIQFLTTMIGRICQLPKWYTSESEAQILFSKFSNKTHCCLHWLLRSGKLSHRSVSVCNFLFANKSRSNLATKTKTNILHQDRSIFYYISVNLGCHTTKLVTHVLHNVWHISIVLVVALSITLHHW